MDVAPETVELVALQLDVSKEEALELLCLNGGDALKVFQSVIVE